MEDVPPDAESIQPSESHRRQMQRERNLTIRLLRLANSPNDLHGLMREATHLLQEWSGCAAVGIRLRDGDDFPYFETRGFPADFIEAENSLCVRDLDGQLARDRRGDPVLECMCGNILCGRFDPSQPFFTAGGSFWTNSTSQLLASTSEADRQARTRNRCHGEGYESVALIPLRADGNTFGLLQLNDHRLDRFTTEFITTLEALAAALAEAIARRFALKELRQSRDRLQTQTGQLRQTERHLRGLLDAVDQSVMLLEPDGTILDCNQTFAERLGRRRSEILGQDVYALLPPETAELRRQRVDEAIRLRSAVEFVDQRWGRRMAHRIVPIFDDQGEILRFAVQGADITDQTRLAEWLQASNELLEAIRGAQSLFIAEGDPKAVFAGLLRILVGITKSEYGFLDEVVYREDRPVLKRSLAISDISWDESSRKLYEELADANFVFPNLDNLAGCPAVSGEVVIANDAPHDARSGGLPPGHPPLKSFLGIPIRHAGQIVGVAGVANRPSGYDRELVEFLEPLTSACAAMIVALRAERKALESQEALRRSENHFKLLYEQAPLGYQSLDAAGRFLEVNQAWLDLLGYSREEVLGRSFAEFMTGEDRPKFAERFPRFKEQGEVRGCEVHLVRKDGTSLTVSIDGRIARDQNGAFLRTHCILHDVTDRRRAEAAIRRSQAELRAIYDSSPLMMCVLDTQRRLLYMNRTMAEYIGKPEEELKGQRACGIIGCINALEDARGCGYGRDCESCALRLALMDTLETGRSCREIERRLTISGRDGLREVILLASTALIQTEAGENLLITLGDITEPRRAEEALRESERRLNELASNIPGAVYQFVRHPDGSFEIPFMSQGGVDLLDRPLDVLQNPARLFENVHADDLDSLWASVEQSAATLGPWYQEFRIVGEDGNEKWVRGASNPTAMADGSICWNGVLLNITAEKRGEEALRESEQRFRSLFDNAIVGVALHEVVFDHEGEPIDYRFLQANSAFERHTGLRLADILGKRVSQVLPPEEASHFTAIYGNVVLTGIPVDFEAYSAALDRHFRVSAYRVGFGQFASVFLDVSDRVRAAEIVRRSEERFRKSFHEAPIGAAIVALDHRFQEVNEALCRITGYDAEELLSRTFDDITHPDDLAEDVEQARKLVCGAIDRYSMDKRYVRKDGQIAWVHLSVRLLTDQAGQPSGFLPMIVDITDRKRMENAIHDREALLNQAEEIMGMGSFIWDVESDGFSSSSGLHRLCGLNESEFPNDFRNAIFQIVHPQDQDRIRTETDRMVTERRAWPVEFRIVRSDGQERLIHCEFQALLGTEGRAIRYVGTVQDITNRRADEIRFDAMQQQLNHASRLAVMGELSAGIAHEVNQPLCSIVNFAKACQNVAAGESVDLAQIRQWTESITTAATRAGDILRRLRAFSRREAVVRESVPVYQLIDDAVLLVQHEARSNHVTLKIDVAQDDLVVRVHPVRVQQILVNLLCNSIEALSTTDVAEKRIAVTVKRLSECIQVSVEDNGVGLEKCELERLFEPFFTTKPQGLGLGLAISRTIVEDHGGRIEAAINSSGGLTVEFTLPA